MPVLWAHQTTPAFVVQVGDILAVARVDQEALEPVAPGSVFAAPDWGPFEGDPELAEALEALVSPVDDLADRVVEGLKALDALPTLEDKGVSYARAADVFGKAPSDLTCPLNAKRRRTRCRTSSSRTSSRATHSWRSGAYRSTSHTHAAILRTCVVSRCWTAPFAGSSQDGHTRGRRCEAPRRVDVVDARVALCAGG